MSFVDYDEINQDNPEPHRKVDDPLAHILAEKRNFFILRSAKSGQEFWYKSDRSKQGNLCWYIAVLPDGADFRDFYAWMYIGLVNVAREFILTNGSKLPEDDERVKAFDYTFKKLLRKEDLTNKIEILHLPYKP
jgi:hypothetical protein